MTNPPPITISITPKGSARFKSIERLVWENIPPLAVLTGLNGSGKTQLLEMLAHWLADIPCEKLGDLRRLFDIGIVGDQFSPDSIAYVASSTTLSSQAPLTLTKMEKAIQQLFSQYRGASKTSFLQNEMLRTRLEQELGQSISHIPPECFFKLTGSDFSFMLRDDDPVAGLAHVFLSYRLRRAAKLENLPLEAINASMGLAPWDVLNDILKRAQFPYRVKSPLGTDLLSDYTLEMEDERSGLTLDPTDLSTGEQVFLKLVMWLYRSQHRNRLPRLLLLDEPDAHLHPSMAHQLMTVLKDVLVDRYGVRVILTTHSPSTVALSPEGSIFELKRGATSVRPSSSKAETAGLLTAGLVLVSPATRYVFVEDKDDTEFYNVFYQLLRDSGPSRDVRALKPSASIVFLPVSTRDGGGRQLVEQWVAKLNGEPLRDIFRGIIDLDGGNPPADRLHVLGRYCVENYLVDPIVVFGLLNEQGTAPSVPQVNISQGDEHLIRSLSAEGLQSIVDVVKNGVEATNPTIAKVPGTLDVSFTNGVQIQYPRWMIVNPGKGPNGLMKVFQDSFGGPGVISRPRLIKIIQRVRLIPKEIADILHELQE